VFFKRDTVAARPAGNDEIANCNVGGFSLLAVVELDPHLLHETSSGAGPPFPACEISQ
jgi:hypothetical protein